MKDDWSLETLGSIAEFRGGGTPSTENPDYWDGDIPWVSPKDMKSDEIGSSIDTITQEAIKNSAACLIPVGAVLIVVRSGILARTIPTALTICDLTVNQDIKALCPAKRLDTRYLHYFMRGAEKEILKLVTRGATVHRISTDSLKTFPILVPPLPEQKRIVAILDEAFEGIDTAIANAKANHTNACELFDSYLETVFSGSIREGWIKKPLSAVCQKITVGHVGSMATRYQEKGVPFLRSQNIKPFEISMENVVFIDDKFHLELKKSRLAPGDLAVVRTGYPGTAAVIPTWLPDANCSDIVIIRPNSEINPHYLAAFFNSTYGKRLVLGKIVGAAQKHFNITAAREVMLHYPSVLYQAQIVSKLGELHAETERLESVYRNKIAFLNELKQSILQMAFTGELTVQPEKLAQEAAE